MVQSAKGWPQRHPLRRDLSSFEWFAFVFANVDDDAEHARRELVSYLGGSDRQDFTEMVDRVAVAAGRAEVVELIQAPDVLHGRRHRVGNRKAEWCFPYRRDRALN